MALGTNSSSPRIFLTVGFGKIRQKSLENKQKVDANTPNAVKRLKKDNTESWALEHDFVSGTIENIFYKEDQQYGNSFEVVICDMGALYQLSLQEESRFWIDFMKKLPNVDLSKDIKITAYDFTDREGKHRAGISLLQNEQKIQSYYETKSQSGTWTILHGFPASEGVNFKDKDELKVYFIQVKKFLRNEFNRLFSGKFQKHEEKSDTNDEYTPSVPDDDLPF